MIIDLLRLCVYNVSLDVYSDAKLHQHVSHKDYFKHTNQKVPTLNNVCKKGLFEMAKYIVHKKANGCATKNTTRVVLNASKSGNVDLVDFLIKNEFKYNQNIFTIACKKNHILLVKYFHEKCGMNINNNKLTDIASKNGNLELLKYLTEIMHINIGKKCVDNASEHDHLHVLKYLFTHHDNKYLKYSNKAMYSASRKGNIEIVRYLHSHNVKSNSKCISIAVQSGEITIARYLTASIKSSKMKRKVIDKFSCITETKDYIKSIRINNCKNAIFDAENN